MSWRQIPRGQTGLAKEAQEEWTFKSLTGWGRRISEGEGGGKASPGRRLHARQWAVATGDVSSGRGSNS
eukprot:479802-Hanusia_phi.AAC.1